MCKNSNKTCLIFIPIFLFILFSNSESKDFKFAWLSDTHVGNSTGEMDLRISVNDINSFDDIDFVIISGDVTQTGKDEDLILAKQILDNLKVKYYIIPGNHDTKWSESGATKFSKLWGNDKFVFEYDRFTFIGLHEGPLMKMADGHFAPEDIRWFEKELSKIEKDKPVIIVTHYPVDPSIDNWFELIDRSKKHNIQFLMVGHGHANRQFNFEGIPGVMGRSNLKARNPLGGYNIVEVRNDTAYFSERTPGIETKSAWNKIAISKKIYLPDTAFHFRPDFSVNNEFPEVKEQWKYNTNYVITSSPAVWKDFVVSGNSSGNVYCFSISDGELKWSFETKAPVYSTPDIEEGKVVFGSTDSNFYCLNISDGKLLWKLKTNAAVVASPAIENGVIYSGASDGKFRAINLSSGELIWEYDKVGEFVETKPLIYGDKVFFGAWDTYFYALNINEGTLAWKWTNGNPDQLYSPAACHPVAANGKVFIVAPDRYMTAIDVNSGKTIWRSNKFLVREAIGVSNDQKKVYTRCMTDTLIAFDSDSDHPNPFWISDLDYGYDINPSMPVEKDGIIFLSTKNGFIYSINSFDGKLKWKYRVCFSLINTVVPVSGSDIIVTNMDGEVMRFLVSGDR